MSIDFEIPPEAKAIREKVRKWVHDECIPAEKELDTTPLAEVLGPLRAKARAQGLWCPFVPKQYGGMEIRRCFLGRPRRDSISHVKTKPLYMQCIYDSED